jgi:membrane protease YdiL (CAAX protease family)
MPEPLPGAADSPAPPGAPRRFSTLVTVVCSIVVVIYIGLLGRPLVEPQVSPLAELDRPADSLERLVTRELDLRAAMRGSLRWEWRLYRAMSGDEDPLAEAAGWYAELLEVTEPPASAELYRIVLLAESGRLAKAREDVAGWGAQGGTSERMAGWVAAAYLGQRTDPAEGRTLIAEINDELPENWFSDTLTKRIAGRIGDAGARARADEAIHERGRVLLRRARALMAASAALVLLGVPAGAFVLARRRRIRVADAPLPPVWSGREGCALFVRALGAPQAIALVAFVVLRRETGLGTAIGMAADLPLFAWVIHYLRTRGSTLPAAFGLRPRPGGWGPLAAATLVLVAVALASDTLIELAASYVRLKTHWTDGFTEELLWSGRRRVLLEAVGASVWAPIVEEITFRGLLYGTLRTHLGVGSSALVSALIFTLPHGYALTGSASVLVSGLLWALAYERTRSLLPGMFAHAANNVLSTLWTVAMLR